MLCVQSMQTPPFWHIPSVFESPSPPLIGSFTSPSAALLSQIIGACSPVQVPGHNPWPIIGQTSVPLMMESPRLVHCRSRVRIR